MYPVCSPICCEEKIEDPWLMMGRRKSNTGHHDLG